MLRNWVPIVLSFVLRAVFLFAVWWVLTLGSRSGIGFGLVVSVVAALVSVPLFPQSGYRLNPVGSLRFVWYFLSRSVLAGFDVARRLLAPVMPLEPGEIRVPMRLPEGAPRWLLANTLSLMPGTLSVRFDGDWLLLHCLDTSLQVEADVQLTEVCVGAVFGIELADGKGGA